MYFEFNYKNKINDILNVVLTAFLHSLAVSIIISVLISLLTHFRYDLTEPYGIAVIVVTVIIVIAISVAVYLKKKKGITIDDKGIVVDFGFIEPFIHSYSFRIEYDKIKSVTVMSGGKKKIVLIPRGIYITGGNYSEDFIFIESKKMNISIPINNAGEFAEIINMKKDCSL